METCPAEVSFQVGGAVYKIFFQGVTVQNGNSTWCYNVDVTGDPALSHWVVGVFELCPEQLEEKVLSVTRGGVELQPNQFELGLSDGVFGVKFDVGTSKEESPVEYCITLKGVFLPTAVDVAVKGGPAPAQRKEDALCGPSCVEVDPQQMTLNRLLESIALEETALAHLINAEAHKIQQAVETLQDPNEVVAVQESVNKVLKTAIKFQMLLQFKLEKVLRFKEQLEFNSNS